MQLVIYVLLFYSMLKNQCNWFCYFTAKSDFTMLCLLIPCISLKKLILFSNDKFTTQSRHKPIEHKIFKNDKLNNIKNLNKKI